MSTPRVVRHLRSNASSATPNFTRSAHLYPFPVRQAIGLLSATHQAMALRPALCALTPTPRARCRPSGRDDVEDSSVMPDVVRSVGLPGEHVGDDGCDACTVTESGADDAKASWETSSTVTSRYPRSRSSASGDAPAPTSMTVAVGSVAPVMRRSLVAACCWCSSFSLCALQVVV